MYISRKRIAKIIMVSMVIKVCAFTLATMKADYDKSLKYDIPNEIKRDVIHWYQMANKFPSWTEAKYQRFLALSNNMYMKPSTNMEIMYTANGPVKPLAYTTYKVVNDTILPKEIVFSDKIMFDSYGRRFVVYHELGHAVLLLSDIRKEFNYQIMWHQGLDSYHKFSDYKFMGDKVIQQIRTPEDPNLKSKIRKHYAISSINQNTEITIYYAQRESCTIHSNH